MSDSPLSQNQAESLLRAVNSPPNNSPPDRCASAGTGAEGANVRMDGATLRIDGAHAKTRETVDSVASRPASEPRPQPYDFRQPPQLSRDQLQALQILNDVVAMQFSQSVATFLRGDIQCQLVNVDQCSHQDFVCQMDDPSCFCVINPKPLPGHWMLDIPSKLLFAMIDRMLGGEPCPGESIERPMTHIEQGLIRRVIENFLVNVGEAWNRVVALEPIIDKIENHPHCVSSSKANEMVARVEFSATICNIRGTFFLGVPIKTIHHLNERLDTQRWEQELGQTPTEATRSAIAERLSDAPIDIVVNLARSTISTRDLLGLAVGDVIATEKQVTEPMELSIAQIPKFHVKAGAYQQKVAVQIESSVMKRCS
ncbi:MAG: FliM/FliN family flagellar motor switch protein [Pirellulaceae bacterium]